MVRRFNFIREYMVHKVEYINIIGFLSWICFLGLSVRPTVCHPRKKNNKKQQMTIEEHYGPVLYTIAILGDWKSIVKKQGVIAGLTALSCTVPTSYDSIYAWITCKQPNIQAPLPAWKKAWSAAPGVPRSPKVVSMMALTNPTTQGIREDEEGKLEWGNIRSKYIYIVLISYEILI